jgi:hypothetical protein
VESRRGPRPPRGCSDPRMMKRSSSGAYRTRDMVQPRDHRAVPPHRGASPRITSDCCRNYSHTIR